MFLLHEWALAEGVIKSLLIFLKERGIEEVKEVVVVHGELQQLDVEVFRLALHDLTKETILEKAKFTLREEPAVLKCNKCGHEWYFSDFKKSLDEDLQEAIHFIPELAHSFIKCPECDSVDYSIVKGRGVYIKELVY